MLLPKTYEPQQYESEIYQLWEESGAFKPSGDGEPFCIIMPPPNANGALHWGHAVGYSLTDIITRYARMQGKRTLWLPGTDHAGIETQFVYERDVLAPLGKSHLDFTPDQFYQDVMKFTLEQQHTITNQFKAMGFSADWSKLKFTLDPDIVAIVYDTFKQLHAEGHVYRGQRIVNWCPRDRAAFADIEVERREQEDPFYYLQYGPFQIGTARPETKFGDKYVVMHPDDERYAQYKNGQTFEAEWINGPVKATVIKDTAVDPKFGSGVMTITPWHDPVDFEIAERHKLDKQQIIDYDGRLLPIAGEFSGLPIDEARPKIIAKLKAKKLLIKTEQRLHAIGIHDRCGTTIEPQVSRQWFLRIKELNQPVIKTLQDDRIQFFPKSFKKLALNWLEQEHDWCISRDSCWWGIRMPIYHKTSRDKTKDPYIITTEEKDALSYYGQGNYKAETATFDTWFSSGQWPFATLMSTGDFESFYPTSLMGTAREILHKWVTRMVMFGLYRTKQIPFKNVYLWGLVTDEHGKKMSKSKGNVIDPMAMTAKYGTDALRLAGAISNTPGTDSPMSENRVMGMRNFNNKLWNIARFIVTKMEASYQQKQPKAIAAADDWMLQRLALGFNEISRKIEAYRLNEASNGLYHLLWDDFADWYIEASKVTQNMSVLVYGLQTILKLAHPFVPFITETIWQNLHDSQGQTGQNLLMVSAWPKPPKYNKEAAQQFEEIKKIITEVRAIKAELGLMQISLYFRNSDFVTANSELITKLAGLKAVEEVSEGEGLPLVTTKVDCWLGIDHETIRSYQSSLEKRRAEAEQYVQILQKKLNDPGFNKAPKKVIVDTKVRLEETKAQLQTLTNQIERIKQ